MLKLNTFQVSCHKIVIASFLIGSLSTSSLLEVIDSGIEEIENATQTHVLSINVSQPTLMPVTIRSSVPTVLLRPSTSSHVTIYVTILFSVVLLLLLIIFGVRCIYQRYHIVANYGVYSCHCETNSVFITQL